MAKAVIQKNWYTVQAPDIFSVDEVTETPAEKDSQVVGRRLKEGLQELMEGTDKYYMDVFLKVTEVEGNKAFAEIDGMECSSEYVSRMIRKRSDRMDLVEEYTTADDRVVRVKLVGATFRNTSTRTIKNARQKISDIIEERASEQDYNEFMENIFTGNLQDEIKEKAEKIYPFRDLEVRKTELVE